MRTAQDGKKLAVRWTTDQNIRWTVKLPGWGTSSPVVYGKQVFVTSEAEEHGKKSLLTLCLDRKMAGNSGDMTSASGSTNAPTRNRTSP